MNAWTVYFCFILFIYFFVLFYRVLSLSFRLRAIWLDFRGHKMKIEQTIECWFQFCSNGKWIGDVHLSNCLMMQTHAMVMPYRKFIRPPNFDSPNHRHCRVSDGESAAFQFRTWKLNLIKYNDVFQAIKMTCILTHLLQAT